jgi:cardiolipin synthase
MDFECYLAFVYWNPNQKRYVGVPEGIEVRVIDYDPLSAHDVIGSGRIGKEGRVNISAVTKDRERPDVFFELLTHGNYIELETNRLVSKDDRRAERHYQILPPKWSSRNKYAKDYSVGFLKNFEGSAIGSPSLPLTFHLSLDCFIRFVYWNELKQEYLGLPEGIEVEGIDYDPGSHLGIPVLDTLIDYLNPDDTLGHGFTNQEGTAHLRLFYKDETNPDIYFKYRVPNDKPNRIDLRSNKLRGKPVQDRKIRLTSSDPGVVERPAGTRMPRVEKRTLPIPREWSTRNRYALEDLQRKGYWDSFAGYRIGIAESPYVFDIFEEMPRFITGNRIDYLIDGDQTLPRIEQAIENAEKSIHIEIMFFFNDRIGNRVKDLLIRKAREGVEVRLLFDADTTAGTYSALKLRKIWVDRLIDMPDSQREQLLQQIDAAIPGERLRGDTKSMRRELEATPNLSFHNSAFPYVQLLPSASSEIPNAYQEIEGRLPFFTLVRIDHRKMIIVDGKIGFLGGMNNGEEYLYDKPFDPAIDAEQEAKTSSSEPWVKWHDCFCEIRGPAVRELQKLFRERWVIEGGDRFSIGPQDAGVGTDPNHAYFPRIDPEPENVAVKIASTTPGARFHIQEEYLTLIDNAREEIYIENPYLSGNEVKEHLIRAAKRGVRVHYIFPDEHNDSPEFLYSARIKYEDFLNAGVHVYEYQNHMTHGKVATIDNDITVIGSANFNHSSMFNHYEVNVFVKNEQITSNFKKDLFQRDIEASRPISKADLRGLIQISPIADLYVRVIVNSWF